MEPVLILGLQGERLEELLETYLEQNTPVYCVTNREGEIESDLLSEIICDFQDIESIEVVENVLESEIEFLAGFHYIVDFTGVRADQKISILYFFEKLFKKIERSLNEDSYVKGISFQNEGGILHESLLINGEFEAKRLFS